jgi:glycosyltransferase involved in cell wall biosynthesis
VDVDRFRPRAKPQPGPFRFLLVARLLWDKGVGEYVEAARRVRSLHPEVEFAVAGFTGGDNPSMVPQSQLDAWVQEGVITFLGSFDDMVPVYAQADCIVLPSYYKEGVPRTLLEAQSMGKPAITTDWPGCRDAVRDRITGYLVEPRSASALAERMLALLALDSNSVQAMSRAARDFACSVFDERGVLTAYQDAIAQSLVWHPEHRAQDADLGGATTPAVPSPATARSLESTASLVQ